MEAPDTRVFAARNGEIAMRPADAGAWLDFCDARGVRVLGWEAWVVDHMLDAAAGALAPSAGSWCGLIPTREGARSMIGGSGDTKLVRRQIAATDFAALVDPAFLPFVCLNFTLDE